jgi:histone acetyltransferase
MKRDRWHGYIKDYDGATLMEFCIDPRVDYLSTKRLADQQRRAVMQVPRDCRTAPR